MPASLTIFVFSADTSEDEDDGALEEAARARGAKLVHVSAATLGARVVPALAIGGVVLVVNGDVEASFGLGLGVDEVVRAGECTREQLETAMDRAAARGTARVSDAEIVDDRGGAALGLLVGALGHELANPLGIATMNHELLSEAIPEALAVSEKLMAWASLVAPPEELERLRARQAALPSDAEIAAMLRDTRIALERARDVIRTLADLSKEGADAGYVRVVGVLNEVERLLRDEVGEWAELRVTSADECIARMSRPSFICVMGALVAIAVDGIRARSIDRGTIEISASYQEETVLVEVHYSAPRDPELRLGAALLEAGLGEGAWLPKGRGGGAALDAVRERARRDGAELFASDDDSGATLRLILIAKGGSDDVDVRFEGGARLNAPRANARGSLSN